MWSDAATNAGSARFPILMNCLIAFPPHPWAHGRLKHRDIPLLIGGKGPKRTLRLVAEHGDIWHGFTSVDSYPQAAAVLAEHCAAVGRDPQTIEHSAGVNKDQGGLIADAEGLAELGVTLLTVGVNGPDYDLSDAEELCRWRDRA